MGGIRATKAKGPWVGQSGSGASADTVKVSGSDTTAGYLSNKISQGHNTEVLTRNPAGNEVLEVLSQANYFDRFFYEKPFLQNTPVIKSGKWSVDTTNHYLEKTGAATGADQYFATGIEGDFDFIGKFECTGGTTQYHGFKLWTLGTGGRSAHIYGTGSKIEAYNNVGGAVSVTGLTLTNPFWLRVKRSQDTLSFYYKINDTDSWILIKQVVDALFGHITGFELYDTDQLNRIYELYFAWNNLVGSVSATAPCTASVPYAASINPDTYQGNVLDLLLTGDAVLSVPNSAIDGMSFTLRIRQDGTGNRKLSYSSMFRFAVQPPVLSTAPGALDYQTFIYNYADSKWDYQGPAINVDARNMASPLDYHDLFVSARPFWDNTQCLLSGDFQVNTVAERLDGIAENNQKDIFRQGIEGDFDYAMYIEKGTASSAGIWVEGNSISTSLKRENAADLTLKVSGESDTIISLITTKLWYRIRRTGNEISFYYSTETEPQNNWVFIASYTKELGHSVIAYFDSATNGYVDEVRLIDNTDPMQYRAGYSNTSYLTDSATIALDASRANIFDVLLAGNRTLGAPASGIDGQMITIRVRQDATGNRTLSFDSVYRFSTDLPSPTLSTAANATDYLTFLYNSSAGKWDFVGKVFGF